jgi:hypothetical protein
MKHYMNKINKSHPLQTPSDSKRMAFQAIFYYKVIAIESHSILLYTI